jgi:myxalamid-type polyketide synthase MxaB
VVLTGRSAPKPHAEAVIAELEALGCEVTVARGDVGEADEVQRIVSELPVPLKGIVHAAGVLDDAAVLRQTADGVRKVARPKVDGTRHLHEATKELGLDFFVLFSGGASLLGSPGQANYSAANAFLDAFASWRRGQGLPATSLQWGAWAEVGMAASLGDAHRERQASEGIHTLPLKAGMKAMGRLLGHEDPAVGVLHVDWSTFVATVHQGQPPALLEELVAARPAVASAASSVAPAPEPVVAASGLPPLVDIVVHRPREEWHDAVGQVVHDLALSVLGLDRDRQLDREQPLLDSGLDSLLAVELKNRIMDHGVDVPVARVMTGPSVAQVTQMIVNVVEEQGLHEAAQEVLPTEHGRAPRPVDADPTAAAEAVQQAGWVPPPRPMESGGGIGIGTVIVAFVLGCIVPVVAYVGTAAIAGHEESLDQASVEMPAPEPVTEKKKSDKGAKGGKGKRR